MHPTQSEQPHIFLVDQDKNALQIVHKALYRPDFVWVASNSVEQALQRVQKASYATVVCGTRIGTHSGAEFLNQISALAPDVQRLMVVWTQDELELALQAVDTGSAQHLIRMYAGREVVQHVLKNAVDFYTNKREADQSYAKLEQQTQRQEKQQLMLRKRVEGLEQELEAMAHSVHKFRNEAQQRFKESLGILTKVQAMQNPSMAQHMTRVARLANQIGERAGLSKEELFQLDIASMLHDIGKLIISDTILQMPIGQLDPIALKKYRNHVMLGERLVGGITGLEEAALVIRHHHERYDGKGYPDRMKGETIPLLARILAVANFFDKLCIQPTRRMDPRQAFEMLRRRSGSDFDPNVVAILDVIVQQMPTRTAA